MARSKLVLDKTENVDDLIKVLKKMKEAGFETVDIESPASVIHHYENWRPWFAQYSGGIGIQTSTPPLPNTAIYCTNATKTLLPEKVTSLTG